MDDVAKPRGRRRRHRLPALPDQGGADRGARARPLRAACSRRARRRSSARTRGRRFVDALWAGARAARRPTARSPRSSARPGRCRSPERPARDERRPSRELVRRAQAAGDLRADLVLDDIPMFMCGIGVGDRASRTRCPDAWRRHLAIVIDGLRADRTPRGRLPDLELLAGAMTAPETVTDPDLQEVAWDLSHLLERRRGRSAGRRRRAARATPSAAPTRSPRATPASSPSSTAPGLSRRCTSSPRSRRSPAAPAPTRTSSFSIDTADPPHGALLQRVEEKGTAIETALLFFHLEWAALDDARAEELLATDGLDFAAPPPRDRAPLPPAPAERARGADPHREGASAGAPRGCGCSRSRRRRSRSSCPTRTSRSRSRSRSRGCSTPDREVRRDTAERVTAALQPGLRTRAYTFNTLLADKMTDDRLRAYPHWLAARNLSNEASDESVQALIEAVRGALRAAAPLVPAEGAAARHRQARRLRPHGRRHAGQREGRRGPRPSGSCTTPTARSPASSASLVDRFFDESWIDGPVRPGKRGGAFCSYGVPSVHPYVMLNYTYLRRDVLTLAHELGHGVHAALGAKQGVFHMATPLTLAETASVFGETLVFGRLLEAAPTPESQAVAAGGVDRGLDRDRLPPGRDEPLRAPRAHRAPRRGRAVGRPLRRRCGRSRRRSCSATPSRSPRATAPGGPTSPTSSPRRATSTRTPTASCSRWRSTAATRRRARASPSNTSSC